MTAEESEAAPPAGNPDGTLGQVLDGLGCSLDLAGGVLITDAVVLCKCVWPDGQVSLAMSHSEGMDWILRLGMLSAARTIEDDGYRSVTDDD